MRNTKNEKFKIYNYKSEYNDVDAGICHIVATNLAKEELEKEMMKAGIKATVLNTYVIVPMEYAEIIADYERNDDKYKKRSKRNEDLFGYEDGEAEIYHKEIIIDEDFIEAIFEYDRLESERRLDSFRQAMKALTNTQRRRVVKYFYQGQSFDQIAMEEECSKVSVRESINAAVKKIKKITS